MPRLALWVLCLVQVSVLVSCSGEGFYSIIAPVTIHPFTTYNVTVSVQQITETAKIKLGITGPNFETEKFIEVKPLTVVNVGFLIPDIQDGVYNLNAEGVSGIIFKKSAKLNFADNKPVAHIQTDKATYKPGDLVQFRVVFLNENRRSAIIHKPTVILIKDAAENHLKQFSNLTLNKGVFSGKFQLSDFPLEGTWDIEVRYDDAKLVKKTFEVAKYVLPKFEVTIDAPKQLSVLEEKLAFTVRSKYTFGKWVKGKAFITIIGHGPKLDVPYYNVPAESRHYSPAQTSGYAAVRYLVPQYYGIAANPTSDNSAARSTFPQFHPSYIPGYNPNSGDTDSLLYNRNRCRPPSHSSIGSEYPFSSIKPMEKTIDFNGKEYLEFDMKEIMPLGLLNKPDDIVTILVVMEEELTGKKQNASAEIKIVRDRFKITAPHIDTICNNKEHKFNYTVTVQNLADEPVWDEKNPVYLSQCEYFNPPMKVFKSQAMLNKLGVATFELDCSNDLNHVKVEYQTQTAVGSIDTSGKPRYMNPYFQENRVGLYVKPMESQWSIAKLGQTIELKLNTEKPTKYFIYTVIARGNIASSELITVENEATKTHTFQINVTFEMIPRASVYVHYIEGNDLKFFETHFRVEPQLENKISIAAPSLTKPGEKITLEINTAANSFVGLLGVDQSVLLLKSGNDFIKESILAGLDKVTSNTHYEYFNPQYNYPGSEAGVITLTNANFPKVHDDRLDITPYLLRGPIAYSPQHRYTPMSAHMAGSVSAPSHPLPSPLPPSPPPSPPRVRKQFIETWLFDDLESSADGSLAFSKRIPDTITSWVVTGFSLSPHTGFALTETPTKIQTFRPFFIATNLPYAIKRGEIISIPIILFNYMDQSLETEITLENNDNEFEFVDAEEQQIKRIKQLTVPSNDGETATFKIRAKHIGHITLKVKAISALAGDAIEKQLKVEPEGITIYKNRDYYLHVQEGSNDVGATLKLDIPDDAVLDSEYIEVGVMGDILGSTIKNIDKLVRMPAGCGEQNMVNFVPNILVLRYLESINKQIPAVEKLARSYLEIGYQRELSYKHFNGSYSAFGKSDKAGSTWLTAYVMRSFHQAAKYIDIDPKVMNAGLDFLASVQAVNGSFVEYGKVLDFSHHNDVGLTAFVLLAFLENAETIDIYKDVIARGYQYLSENVQATDDLYALSIAVYTLQLNKQDVVSKLLEKLDAKAHIDGGHKWWTKAVAELRPDQAWRPKSHDVEVTGYLLMTLLEKDEAVLPITKWLISQRNSNGGFASTQETVVGLQALIKFAEKAGGHSADLTIEFTAPQSSSQQLVVNKSNAMYVQTLVLPNKVREISFKGQGAGTAIVQISYRYNILKKSEKPNFKLETKVKPNDESTNLLLDVCTEFVPLDANENRESNMVVMEVALPSGYTADKESFHKIKSIDNVKRIETKNGDTNIVVYFDSLKESEVRCTPIEAERLHEIEEQKPVPVVIYDYYDSQKRATDFYKLEV